MLVHRILRRLPRAGAAGERAAGRHARAAGHRSGRLPARDRAARKVTGPGPSGASVSACERMNVQAEWVCGHARAVESQSAAGHPYKHACAIALQKGLREARRAAFSLLHAAPPLAFAARERARNTDHNREDPLGGDGVDLSAVHAAIAVGNCWGDLHRRFFAPPLLLRAGSRSEPARQTRPPSCARAAARA
jgi:hypothetical protein